MFLKSKFNKIIIGLVALFLLGTQMALTQAIDWLSQHPNTPGSDYYLAVTHDDQGNAYNTGSERTTSLSGCSEKIVLSRFNSSGTSSYAVTYQPASGNGICDEQGNAILYHAGSGKIIIGGKENAGAFLGFFTAATGAYLNKATIGTLITVGSEIKGLTFSGNSIIATGYFRNSITFGGATPITLTGTSGYNVFLAKFDLLGNVLQAISVTSAGSSGNAVGFDVEEDANNNLYISVATNGNLTFSNGGTYNVSGSGHKIALLKVDASFNYVSGVNLGSTSSALGVENEIPLHMDWNKTSLLAAGPHPDQNYSFLTKFDVSVGTPSVLYTHKLPRVVRDLTVDCENIYLTGVRLPTSKATEVEQRAPCSTTSFLFLDRHDLNTGSPLGSKLASGCTFGEGVTMDRNDNLWMNGRYGDPSSMTFEGQSQSFSYVGRNGLISKLTAEKTCYVEPKFCCPGQNLVVNGDFEAGNTGFTSDFMYQAAVGVSSIVPGQYGVINGGQAGVISPTWSAVQDPSTCDNANGKFLVVNGENGGGAIPPFLSNSIPASQIIWEQNFTVQDWRGYKFCFEAKNLDQQGFNVIPKLEVQFSMPVGNVMQTITAPVGACDWQQVSKHLNLWGYGTALNIKIILDQSLYGDGNDVAIDNISLTLMDQCPAASAEFDVSTVTPHPVNPAYYSIIATADIVPPCESVWWEVCEYDFVTGNCVPGTMVNGVWWTTVTDFPGYDGTSTLNGTSNPGLFEYGKVYRVTRGTWGECNSWRSSAKFIGAPAARAKVRTYTEKELTSNKKIRARFRAGSRR